MVSPGEAAVTAALMVLLQPPVPAGLTQRVAALRLGTEKRKSADAARGNAIERKDTGLIELV